jgi:hypothetical protein
MREDVFVHHLAELLMDLQDARLHRRENSFEPFPIKKKSAASDAWPRCTFFLPGKNPQKSLKIRHDRNDMYAKM